MRTPRAAAISRATAVTIASGDTRRSPLAGTSIAVTTCRIRNLHCNERKSAEARRVLSRVRDTGMAKPSIADEFARIRALAYARLLSQEALYQGTGFSRAGASQETWASAPAPAGKPSG